MVRFFASVTLLNDMEKRNYPRTNRIFYASIFLAKLGKVLIILCEACPVCQLSKLLKRKGFIFQLKMLMLHPRSLYVSIYLTQQRSTVQQEETHPLAIIVISLSTIFIYLRKTFHKNIFTVTCNANFQ